MHNVYTSFPLVLEVVVQIRLGGQPRLPLGGNGEQALRLQDDDDVIILVEDRQTHGQGALGVLLGYVQHFVRLEGATSIFLDLAIHLNASALQHLTQRRSRRIGEKGFQRFEQRDPVGDRLPHRNGLSLGGSCSVERICFTRRRGDAEQGNPFYGLLRPARENAVRAGRWKSKARLRPGLESPTDERPACEPSGWAERSTRTAFRTCRRRRCRDR